MNYKKQNKMKSFMENCYGMYEASLEQKMEWIEDLHQQITEYKALRSILPNMDPFERHFIEDDLKQRSYYLKEQLPDLRNSIDKF